MLLLCLVNLVYHISVVISILNKERWCIFLYEKFERLLRERNLTPYRVSRDTGIAQSSLSDWKRGVSKPKVDKLQVLSDYFGVPLKYFLDE
ncbi:MULTISPECIES: helix-turn-helix domain-containing protein [Enterocloster]|uniref:helix-turn-helix domain-containing protein n=1 Tax=Enterocloster TaxID=2719313 RepID=UPI001FA8E7B2|nr:MULTISPECIES: helix-turn-helix transcriptional regulator [Enterocloster]